MKKLTNAKLNIICSFASIALIIVAWITAYYSVQNDLLVPSFGETVISFFKCFADGSFYLALLKTVLRTFLAFAVSFVLAVATCALSVWKIAARAVLKPIIVLLRTLPTLAVVLLILIWSGANAAPVIVTVLVLFPMLHSEMLTAADGVDGGLKDMLKVYNVSKKDKIFKVYCPLVAKNVLPQTGAAFSLGLKVMISAEVLANTYISLGGLMQTAKSYLEMPRLAALTLVAVFLGMIAELAFSQLSKITRKWERDGD